jgi:putative flippase GtrA
MGRSAAVIERLQQGRLGRLVKFGAVSAVSIVITQASLAILFGFVRMSARPANILAACISTIPAYQLSRRWVWQKSGPSHMTREVVPFWSMALLGLAFSTWAAGVMEQWAKHHLHSHLSQTLAIMVSSLASYGVLWLVRFFVLDHLVFHDREVL